MIVISDTSPINYLVLIGHVHILPQLFERIIVPPAVFTEINSPQAPTEVRNWLATTPDWLEVQTSGTVDPALIHLDPGELGRRRLRYQ